MVQHYQMVFIVAGSGKVRTVRTVFLDILLVIGEELNSLVI